MLLTIDIGTSTFKSALWDLDGKKLSFASYNLSFDSKDGYKTDSSVWLRAFEDCCGQHRITANLPLKAIVITGNGPTLVPVTGQPCIKNENLSLDAFSARLWLDRSAEKYQEEVSRIMGGFVDAGFFLPKIIAIKNEEPSLYDKTKYFMGPSEYLIFALTGQAKTVFPSDGFERWFWNDSALEKLGLDKEKFPPFVRPGEIIAQITAQAAGCFDIAHNAPVIAGGPDFFCAILGSGVTQPGQACDRTGSSEGINLCTKNLINDKRLMSYAHPVKPYWNLSGIINTTGRAVQWGCDILGISNIDDFFELAKKSKRGSGKLVFLPYLAGERAPVWDASVRGIWRGLSLDTGRTELANSVLEGIVFAVKDVISVMEESDKSASSGGTMDELRVTGGLASSAYLNQLKADITGKIIQEPVHKEAELLGLAIIGACSLGKYSSYPQAVQAMVKTEKQYEPDIKNAKIYQELFEKYRQISLISK